MGSVLAGRIKSRRREVNKTQKELAKALDVGETTISNYESGYSSPDAITLSKISLFLDTTADYLLGNTDDKRTILQNLKEIINENDVKNSYFNVFKEAVNLGVPPEDLLNFLKTVEKARGQGPSGKNNQD